MKKTTTAPIGRSRSLRELPECILDGPALHSQEVLRRKALAGGRDEETLPIFILSNGRADRIFTLAALKRHGWTGPIFIIVDNEDATVDKYVENFGEESVIVFDKEKSAGLVDTCDNFEGRRSTAFVRNTFFELASKLGFRYFLQLDDDYAFFCYTYDTEGRFNRKPARNLDAAFSEILGFFKGLPMRVRSVAIAQGGDFLGGSSGSTAKDLRLRRKAMNSFFCDVERPFSFIGRLNEDVNAYIVAQVTGDVFFTTPLMHLTQHQTQTGAGGMTDAYVALGTYTKSFYTVMLAPSCVAIDIMGTTNPRIHHKINWRCAVPKILTQAYRKED